jgi:hypothetical protein
MQLIVWFGKAMTFKRDINERCARAEKAARHIRSLANTVDGSLAPALQKAVITIVVPTALDAVKCWHFVRRRRIAHERVHPAPQTAHDIDARRVARSEHPEGD